MSLMVRRLATVLAAFAPVVLAAQRPVEAPVVPNAMARPVPAEQWADYVRRTPVTDPMLLRIVEEGMQRSQAGALAQVLTDSIGPRLTGSPGFTSAGDWLVRKYKEWGVTARKEQWGTWNSFSRGVTHVDLVAPRLRTLEATMLAWSPATSGAVTGDVAVLPQFESADAAHAWLQATRGKFVMISAPNITCRTPQQLAEYATPATLASMRAAQDTLRISFNQRNVTAAGLQDSLKAYGAAGVVTFGWSNYPGINKVFGSPRQQVPTFDLSCEDYGLVYRLAMNSQGPKLKVQIESKFLGEVRSRIPLPK